MMPWNPERYMKKEEVIKILEDNKITNVQPKKKTTPCTCGRSPDGTCIGWHKLTEREYIDKKQDLLGQKLKEKYHGF